MSKLKPGVYRATIFGKDRVGLVDRDGDFTYNNAVGESVQTPVSPRRVEDNLRPLIVLDLNAGRPAKALVDYLNAGYWYGPADQIEAQTKPARIPEPGLWGVVEASVGNPNLRAAFIRDEPNDSRTPWIAVYGPTEAGKRRAGWSDLIDPTLIREGVN